MNFQFPDYENIFAFSFVVNPSLYMSITFIVCLTFWFKLASGYFHPHHIFIQQFPMSIFFLFQWNGRCINSHLNNSCTVEYLQEEQTFLYFYFLCLFCTHSGSCHACTEFPVSFHLPENVLNYSWSSVAVNTFKCAKCCEIKICSLWTRFAF